ncbi:nucleotide exchange factor GrpE [Streptosporangium sp. NPDC023963]|uniref:nucleotide exchange factor GrpE n=1 Tax=Streptosporangium sp. NPDC023963 TaxID=3155608 RepID=UPI003442D973
MSEPELLPLTRTIQEDLAGLLDLFRRRLLSDRESREAMAALQEQLMWTRQNAEGATVRPLLYDLVLLADRIERSGEAGEGFAASLRAEVLEVLAKYGVSPVPAEEGPFDPSYQEALGTVPTDEKERHGTVAQVVRNGYRVGDRVLRTQQVRVYMCQD